MLFKFVPRRTVPGDDRLRVNVFASSGTSQTYQLTGTLVLTPEEWKVFKLMCARGAGGTIAVFFDEQEVRS